MLKKNMDALISREVSEGITGTINWVTRFSEGLKDTFSNSMPTIKSVFEKYPYNFLQLRKDYPLLDKQLEALETQLVEHEGADETQIQGITKQIDNLSRGYYKKKIEEDNPDLADILGELREKDFDFSLIGEARLQNLLNWVKDQKIEDMEAKRVISDIFNIKQPVDEIHFKNFMKDLVDIK
ncbi:hypothetical protein FACS1894176_11730 [Bacteroidia bacterium]|nr:hypothetical protein FACS1894176_11730 [Bacteroidia bacterium]